MQTPLLLSILVISFIVFEYVFVRVFKSKVQLDQRIEEVHAMGSLEQVKKAQKKQIKTLKFLTASKEFKEEIRLSGIRFKPEEYMTIWFFIVLFPTIIVYTFTTELLTTIAIGAICFMGPLLNVRMKVKKRRQMFAEQLSDALMIIANGLRAGYSFAQALDSVSQTMQDPISSEFKQVVSQLQIGVDTEEAMMGVVERMQSEDFKLLTTSVIIQQQVGGNLSEIMDTIAKTIRDRFKIQRSVKTLTAQGRMSGYVVGALPILILMAVSLMNPDYMEPMFNDPRGQVMLALGAIMEVLGFLLIKKIVDIKL